MDEFQKTVDRFHAKANALFPGSSVVHEDDYEKAKFRLLNCVRTGAPSLAQVNRWALACEAAALAREEFGEPHRSWAQRLIDTDLHSMIAKFAEAGIDTWEDTADPLLWKIRWITCSAVRRLVPAYQQPTEYLGDPEDPDSDQDQGDCDE